MWVGMRECRSMDWVLGDGVEINRVEVSLEGCAGIGISVVMEFGIKWESRDGRRARLRGHMKG